MSGWSTPDPSGLLDTAMLSGDLDAPIDSLPLRVVVVDGTVDAEVVSGFAESWRAVEPFADVEARRSSGDGGLVDPVSGEGLGEDVERRLVVFCRYEGVVGVSSAGHRRVDAAAVDGAVDEEKSDVDGAALGGVAGVGVAELDVFPGVVGGEPDGA